MPYRNVGTPRFFINVNEWASTNGIPMTMHNIYRTLPVNPKSYRHKLMDENGNYSIQGSSTFPQIPEQNFFTGDDRESVIFILGHDLATPIYVDTVDQSDTYASGDCYLNAFHGTVENPIISINENFTYNGFSAFTRRHNPNSTNGGYVHIHPQGVDYDFIASDYVFRKNIGSIAVCSYYTMPRSPDLSVNLKWEYGGSSHKTTYKGGSISNTVWSKPPMWGDFPPWELINPLATEHSVPVDDYKSGRRIWQLKFSYIDDGDLWGSNQLLNKNRLSTDGYDSSDILLNGDGSYSGELKHNILSDQNFYSQVWHRTLGGTIPFIFQPDSNNSNADQFAICRFKDNSLDADQVAPGVYDVSLEVEEVW